MPSWAAPPAPTCTWSWCAGFGVSGSLTVGLVEPGEAHGDVEQALLARLREGGDVVEAGHGQLAGPPALRRRRRLQQQRPDGTSGPALVTTGVDWVVPLPDEDGLLVLAFATSTEPVAEELVELFDAIASSLELTAR